MGKCDDQRKGQVMHSIKRVFHYVVFAVLLFVTAIIAVEVASPVVLYFRNDRWLSRAEIQQGHCCP